MNFYLVDSINTNLFDGNITLENDNYRFCISGSTTNYTATAYRQKTGGTNFTIKHNKEDNKNEED